MSSLEFNKIRLKDDSDLDYIPCESGVYLWKSYVSDDGYLAVKSDSRLFASWLADKLKIGVCGWSNVTFKASGLRDGMLIASELVLGKSNIESLKPRLERMPISELERLKTLLFKVSETYSPVIYVGESKNLRKRALEHLNHETGLHERIQMAGLNFSDLEFHFVVLGDGTDKESLKVFERVIGEAAGAFASERLG